MLSPRSSATVDLLEDTDDYRVGWRIFAPAMSGTWICGGTLVELWYALYTPPVAAPAAMLAITVLAQLVGLVIALSPRPPGAWAPHVIILGSTLLVTVGMFAIGGVNGQVELIYLWSMPYAFVLLRTRPAVLYTVFAGCASVVSNELRTGPEVGGWMFDAATLVVLAVVTRHLVVSLRTGRVLLRQAYAGSPLGSGFVDRADRWLAVNAALCRLTGRSEAELLRLGVADVLEPVGDDEYRVLREDGAGGWAIVTRAPILSDAGDVVCTSVQLQDITARHLADEASRRDAEAARWLDETREALADDRIVLHAQPIFDVAGGHRAGEELLARLVGRDGEIVAPGRFMPAVERFGLSPDFDVHVLRKAAALAGRGRRVSANLSAASIGVPRVLDALRDAVSEFDVQPGVLTIELTETALAEDAGSFAAFAHAITATGCRLALDDFGTGYGTLTYLTSLPVDVIKIDRVFVSGVDRHPDRAEIIASLVGLARRLGKETVAEGVERPEELALLEALGVDRVQGFLLGRPERVTGAPRVPEGHYTS